MAQRLSVSQVLLVVVVAGIVVMVTRSTKMTRTQPTWRTCGSPESVFCQSAGYTLSNAL